jgi:anti-anti-sigma factor
VLTTCFAFLLLVLAPAAAQSWRSITLQEIVSYGSMLMMSPTLIVLVGTMANTRAVEAARLTHQQTEPFGNVHTSPAAPPEVRREDNDFQRPILCALRVPVMPVDRETLIVSLHGAFDHRRLNDLQQRTLTAIHQTPVQRLVLDVTGTSVIDSTRAEDLVALVQEAQLLGIEVVLVGLRPKVAQSIVSRGLDLTSLRMFPDLHVALEEVRPFASPAFPQTYRRN